jgi:hypothetical protein
VGPLGNLGDHDVAVSKDMHYKMGQMLDAWQNGEYLCRYRAADWSFRSPGQPNHGVVEFRDRKIDGNVEIRPVTSGNNGSFDAKGNPTMPSVNYNPTYNISGAIDHHSLKAMLQEHSSAFVDHFHRAWRNASTRALRFATEA